MKDEDTQLEETKILFSQMVNLFVTVQGFAKKLDMDPTTAH